MMLTSRQLLPQVARKFPDIKFLTIRADLCVENYPERNTPTILIYKDTDIVSQVVTLASLNGVKTNVQNLELLLVKAGAIREEDARLREGRQDNGDAEDGKRIRTGGKGRGTGVDDDDDDWD